VSETSDTGTSSQKFYLLKYHSNWFSPQNPERVTTRQATDVIEISGYVSSRIFGKIDIPAFTLNGYRDILLEY
jgi:hypothetical protein